MNKMLNVIIVRHAQAVDSTYLTADHERRLTPRGERDAAAVGRLRRTLNLPPPDLVFSSGYERAEQTLDRVLEGQVLDVIRDPLFSPEGSVEGAWSLVCAEVQRRFSQTLPTVWIFGHNPNIERFIAHISPALGAALRPYRKATLAWIRVFQPAEKEREAQLMAYIPRAQDDRDKSAELEL